MEYYKPLANLNVVDTVKFQSIGSAETGKFGEHHQCLVKVDGQEMTWTLSADKLSQLTKAGFGVGSTVRVEKWAEGVKKGYNFKPTSAHEQVNIGDIAREVMDEPPKKEQAEDSDYFPVYDKPFKQEPNLAGNGASFNLAFMYVLKLWKIDMLPNTSDPEFTEFMTDVLELAEKIKPIQSQFVNGK